MSGKAELPEFLLGSEHDDKNFKSCFARSVAVNSQYKQTKSLDFNNGDNKWEVHETNGGAKEQKQQRFVDKDRQAEVVRFRKNSRNHSLDDTRRYSCGNMISSRRASLCTSRIAEIPVDNFVNQSKIETLQWQLKEIEKSREMYKAVMRQVVTFLEKAHHSLELLGSRLNQGRKPSVTRCKSDHQIRVDTSGKMDESNASVESGSSVDVTRECSWQPPKNRDLIPEETPPDKLSQEAFRLLRTACSLLNTNEPDLAHLDPPDDLEFLSQLAREFPQTPEHKPQRATSFSLSPKLIQPDADLKISTAFNRKLSLQLGEARRGSSGRRSVAESDGGDKEKEKAGSPATGSVSSVEDESGFSSMNSFQDVGLPLVNSTMVGGHAEEVSAKHALLRSMLHNTSDFSSPSYTSEHNSLLDSTVLSRTVSERSAEDKRNDDIKLWQKPSTPTAPQHKRWYSTPVDDSSAHSVKVLWV